MPVSPGPRLHKIVLDSLGVKQVAVVIGGSMGGMTTLEYPLNTPKGYVRHIIPIATSARHSAWGISWGEAQRQSIYSDPAYDEGYYCFSDEEQDIPNGQAKGNLTLEEQKKRMEEKQPTRGLAAARMAALLTYRSRDSFESRFGRKQGAGKRGRGGVLPRAQGGSRTPRRSDSFLSNNNLQAHNDGHRHPPPGTLNKTPSSATTPTLEKTKEVLGQMHVPVPNIVEETGPTASAVENGNATPPLTNLDLSIPGGSRNRAAATADARPSTFSAQNYLRYQGDKVRASFISLVTEFNF